MREKIFITSVGNSQYYTETEYIFTESGETSLNSCTHWYSSYALLTHLRTDQNWYPDGILVLYPETDEGKESYYKDWKENDRKPIKNLLQKFCENNLDAIKVPNIKSDENVWEFLNILTGKLRDIEE